MHRKSCSRARRAHWPASLALALAACGGGDLPDATVSAAGDAATLDWRSSALVDVLANDSASRGTLSLLSVEAPAHGTAVIEAGKVRYTPVAGWFGSDSLRYTVRADAGGATASATVSVTVQARLALSGRITDGPIADAAVTLKVGEQTLELSADAQGRYATEVLSADPDAWVQLSGRSPDGRVRLVSVVGALAAVAAADGGTGAVDAAALPALDATHWTSAEAALRARALGGRLPASGEDMAASDGALGAAQLQSLATAVRLVADAGLALPTGAADSFALLLDRAATQTLLANSASEQPETYAAATDAVLASAPAPAGSPWMVSETRHLSYVDGGNPVSSRDLTLTLQPDGQATIHQGGAAHAGHWTADGAVLTLTLATPTEDIDSDCLTDPVSGDSACYETSWRTLGYRLRAVAGGSVHKPQVMMGTSHRSVWREGPKAGELISESDGSDGHLAAMFDLAGRTGVAADELTPGARLAGIPSSDTANPLWDRREDILRIDGPGRAHFEIGGQAASWSLDDGWLTVSTEGMAARRYTRLERDPTTGLESWIGASVPADAAEPWVYYADQNLLFADAGLSFTTGNAARRWRAEGFVIADPAQGLEPSCVLNPDGSATGLSQRWGVAADGTLELVRVRAGKDYPRRWIPLRRVGEHLIVLELVDFGYVSPGSHARRINWQVDLGPAGS